VSRYTELKTHFKDSECLFDALSDMGYKVIEGSSDGTPLVGYQGDYRRKDDWNAHTTNPAEALKAHIIVRRKHIGSMANDLGFQRMPDGTFRAIISDYDSRQHNGAWVQKLTHRYNIALDKKKAKAMGYTVAEKQLEGGGVKLTLRR